MADYFANPIYKDVLDLASWLPDRRGRRGRESHRHQNRGIGWHRQAAREQLDREILQRLSPPLQVPADLGLRRLLAPGDCGEANPSAPLPSLAAPHACRRGSRARPPTRAHSSRGRARSRHSAASASSTISRIASFNSPAVCSSLPTAANGGGGRQPLQQGGTPRQFRQFRTAPHRCESRGGFPSRLGSESLVPRQGSGAARWANHCRRT
jgi:hypothetical protein